MSWVGGDIDGLRALATTLYSFVPEITGSTAALDERVTQLTGGDQGWRGPAAAAFTAAWHRDSVTAEALTTLTSRVASIVDALAGELAMIESTLEEQAHAAARYGVAIGTDGRPPPVLTNAPAFPPVSAAAASERHWALVYRQQYEQARADAHQARQQAARQLTDLCAKPEPPSAVPAERGQRRRRPGRVRHANTQLLPVSYPRPAVEPGRLAIRSQGCVAGVRAAAI